VATPTASTSNTPTPSSTATFTVESISQNVEANVFLDNTNLSSQPVETAQATATSTPSFSANFSVGDTNVDMSGSSSAAQTSSVSGSTISLNASAMVATDVSACLGQPEPCFEQNQGFTEFDTQFCIGQETDFSLGGSEQASASEDDDEILAVAALTITSLTPPETEFVNEQAFNNQTVPISMDVPLPAGCYDLNAKIYADANAVSASGSAQSSCSVTFSPD
jgi:hypothetical protein